LARDSECAAAEAAATYLARREHFVVAASAATNFIHDRFPRAERGAGLPSAPPRATVFAAIVSVSRSR
jgi:hypothetical protein